MSDRPNIIRLPSYSHSETLPDAQRGIDPAERAQALRNASRAAEKARDEQLYGFSAERNGRRIDPIELLPDHHKRAAIHYSNYLDERRRRLRDERRRQEAQHDHDDMLRDAEDDARAEHKENEQ